MHFKSRNLSNKNQFPSKKIEKSFRASKLWHVWWYIFECFDTNEIVLFCVLLELLCHQNHYPGNNSYFAIIQEKFRYNIICINSNQDLNVLDRAVTSTEEASSGRGSSDEYEDDKVMKILCLLFLQRMKIKIRTR